jgi:hypothetical protein
MRDAHRHAAKLGFYYETEDELREWARRILKK